MTTQFWLAKLDQYGNPTLVDGAHSERSGVEKAMYLFDRLHLSKGESYACAEVVITPVNAKAHGANEDAIETLNAARSILPPPIVSHAGDAEMSQTNTSAVVAHMTVHSLNGRKEAFAIATPEASKLADGDYALCGVSAAIQIFPSKKSPGSWIVQTPDGIGRSYDSKNEAEKAAVYFQAPIVSPPKGIAGERVKDLREPMEALLKAASEVSMKGAQTGPQWVRLMAALSQARSALTLEGGERG